MPDLVASPRQWSISVEPGTERPDGTSVAAIHTLPWLADILIRRKGERVSFLSTEIEVAIRALAGTGATGGRDGQDSATTMAARAGPECRGRRPGSLRFAVAVRRPTRR